MARTLESDYLDPHHIGKPDEDYVTGFEPTSLDAPQKRCRNLYCKNFNDGTRTYCEDCNATAKAGHEAVRRMLQ